MLLSKKRNVKRIIGDSITVINDWKSGKVLSNKLSQKIIDLIEEVRSLRDEFELLGGEIQYIPGGINAADLGFHED